MIFPMLVSLALAIGTGILGSWVAMQFCKK